MIQEIISIQTERLRLEAITHERYEYIMTRMSDAAIMRLFGYATEKELEQEKLRYKRGMTSNYTTFVRFVLIDPITDTTIGQCGFHKWYQEHSRAEFGYALNDEAVKNKGFMTEAAKPIIAYGFEVMELNRIEAFASPLNIASIRILEKLGFSYEGLMREHFFKNNIFEDSASYALLKKDYSQVNS